MTKVIWKTVLQAADEQTISVPAGAEFICARDQIEQICVWYICDPEAPREERWILMAGTGHDAPNGRYIGTGYLYGGQLVFHVFDGGKPQPGAAK